MSKKVKVISVEDAGYYIDGNTSGSMVKVTLQRGKETVSCDEILIWEEALADSDCFDEWMELALAGEEGYAYTAG